uniref:E3 ubiquitin-protein ligase n=1 Tax=Panagrellus redivivus TaxID=6233 RepID=A0A7E4W8K1_PANRE
MADLNLSIDYSTMLEWLDTGDRDLQISALENLCMTLLMSDNVDRCFENCPPRQFLPALCRIFLDEDAPVLVLEAAARAMTYYMEVSNECSRRITAVEGTLKAICNRISNITPVEPTGKDLVEQCVKVLEHICQRETGLVHEAGGFPSVLTLVRDFHGQMHRDTLRSALSVITRLCSKIEPDTDKVAEYSDTLGNLLTHEDLKVSESALRSIAAIVDRFSRKHVDPSDFIGRCGLIERLLGLLITPNGEVSSSGEPVYVLSGRAITFISIVLSLLNNLCRGSAAATDLVVRSPMFLPILKPVMTSSDERCVSDGLRLTGMILGLICDGRPVTEKVRPLTETALSERFTEKHKELVDSIRAKNFETFKNLIESNGIDVNYTDDVGQALINWTAAFGTLEMAVYLLDHNANVDGGTRSSSLHYAAIFGRPDMTQLLLERGANPELRDEEGRTALEKARGRKEEQYQKVARLLEYPMAKSSQEINMCGAEPDLFNRILTHLVPIFCTVNKSASSAGISRSSLSLLRKCITKLPPDVLRVEIVRENFNNEFAENLMSMFENSLDHEDPEVREQVFLMMQSLLDRDTEFWREQFARLGVHEIVEKIANEDLPDDEDEDSSSSEVRAPGTMTDMALSHAVIFNDGSIYNDTEASLRQQIAKAISTRTVHDATVTAIRSNDRGRLVFPGFPEGAGPYASTSRNAEASSSIRRLPRNVESSSTIKCYRWHDWRIVSAESCVYIWCDYIAIVLNRDGTSQYVAENEIGKVQLFAPSQSDSINTFMERFTMNISRTNIMRVHQLFDDAGDNWMGFGNWDLLCLGGKNIDITNADVPRRKLHLTYNVAGFSIRSDDGVTTVTGSAKLSKEFETGFVKGTQTPPIVPSVSTVPNLPAVPSLPNVPNLPIIKPVSHKTATRQRVIALAKELWNRYLCHCKNNMRLELKLLKSNARAILDLFEQLQDDDIPDRKLGERRLYNNLLQARHVLLNDNSLSIFEIGSSGIVQTLQILFEYSVNHRNSKISRIIYDIFSGGQNINVVVRKIVQVMESQENFPVVRYDKPNSSTTGMKLLTRRFYLNLEQANPQDYHQQKLVDNTGRSMKTDPLTTVAHFKLYFLQMLSKFWFDADRSSLAFVQKITEATEKKKELVFEYTHNFDKNGIVYYLGTNGHTEDKWINPITCGLVTAVAGDSKVLPFDPVDEIFSRDETPANCHTFDKQNAKFVFDLGVYVHPTVYTLRHSEGYDNSALRTWNLEGSADNYRWFVISRHENDRSLMAPGDTASWAVNPKVNVAFRYFRIAIKGPNSSGKTHFLSCSGFEIYGNVVGVESKKLPPPTTRPRYPVDTGPPVVNQHSWAFCAASDPENDDHLWDAPSNVPVDVWRQPPPNSIDNSEPPMPLSDNDRSQRDRGLSRRSRRPSAADRYHDAPAAEPKLVSKVFRPKIVIPVEHNPVKLQPGYNVRYIQPSKNQAMYGYLTSIEKDGRVVVYWDYGERVLTNPSELGVLINQITAKEPTPEPVAGSSSSSAPSSSTTKNQQKSMSTTNLLDERVGRRLPTFQAVSADSLQNPTVSLENLIVRSRLFAADRIPEVGDEQSPSDAPESANAENAPVSVAASTFGGGSHPLLSYARRSAEHNPALFGMSALGPTEEAMRELNDIRRRRQADNDAVAALASAAATAHESAQELFNEEDEAELEESDGEEDPEAEDEDEDDDDEDDDEDEEELEPLGGADEYYVYAPTARATSQHIQPPVQAYAGLISEHGGTSNHSGIRLLDSAHVAFAEAASGSRGQSSSTSRPARVADYADALRTVMQQVIDAAGSEEVDDDLLFNDDYDEEDGNIEDVNDINDVITHGLSSLSDHASFRDSFVENMFYHTPFGHHDPGRSFVSGGARSRIPTSSESAARAAFRQYVNMPGHLYDIVPGGGSSRGDPDRHNHGSRKNRKPLRHWDDDFTLKPAYSALIPVFDPRPGRNNVNQTQDVELPSVNTPNDTLFKKEIGIRSMPAFTVAKTDLKQKDLRLYLRGPNIDTIQNVTVEMANDDRKFVYYAQKLLNMTNWKEHAGKRHNRIWDPTFTLIYEVRTGSDSTVEATHLETGKFSLNQIQNEEVVVAALEALFSLKRLNDGKPLDVNTDQLISEKLTQKINLILSDPLVVAGNALPDWVEYMLTKNKHLFDLETRRKYHMATAFGTARSIVWTQTQLDSAGETNTANAAQSRREDSNDYRIGRLKHERIKVPRDDDLFATAVRVFRFHAIRKSVLEIQYIDEEGTGLGPTLEFFALVAAEFQRKSRAIWICDDDDSLINKGEVTETDLGSGLKPAGYYIRRAGGLFPAPIPPQTEESYRACELFRVLGIFLAKVIQDNRLVDIPLSLPLLRLLIEHPKNSNLRSILTLGDFDVIYPEKARFVRELDELISLRDDVLKDCTSRHQRSDALRNLNIALPNTKCTLDELGLTYVVDPPSNVFEYRGYELIPDGSNVDVTLGNVNEYVEHVINFHLNTGIRPQIDAFREGFNLVCPLKSLSVFTPDELLTTLCGDQSPQWTAEELYKYTAPKNGYTVESTTFRRFVEVLVEMNAVQRKAFLQFATGCSSLPPGGLANLHPPLTIVRKGESDDGAYPSVNTCVHYLKMPDYSTKELLRERLFSATLEKGFYLN